jgi:selenium metabolism protein YedF
MDTLDCRGKTCPAPVIEAKKLIDETAARELRVLVDNATARENVQRFLESRGYGVTIEEHGTDFLLSGKKADSDTVPSTTREKRITVFVDSDTMGRGDERLGSILMKSFVYALTELETLPWRIAFVNAGIKLVCDGSELLPKLKELEDRGVEILACGTCLDFYVLKEKLKVGRVSNMFEIVSSLTESTHVLKP